MTATIKPETQLLNESDVSAMLDVSVATVRRWRQTGQGPRFLKIGALCKYRAEDIAAWLDARPVGGEPLQEARA